MRGSEEVVMRIISTLVGLLVCFLPTFAEASLGTVEWSHQYDNWVKEVRIVYTYYPDPRVPLVIYDAFLCPSFDALVEGANTLYQGDVSQSPRMTGVKTLEQFGECRLIDGDLPVRDVSWIGPVAIFTADGTVVEGNVYWGILNFPDGSIDAYVLIPPQPE